MKRWPLNKAQLWERYPFFRLLIPLVAGILLYPLVQNHLLHFNVYIITAFIVSLGIFAFVVLKRQTTTTLKTLGFITANLGICSATLLLSYHHDICNNPLWFGHHINDASRYIVRITDVPAEKTNTWKLETEVQSIARNDSLYPARGKAFVYYYKYGPYTGLHEGDIISVPAEWERIKNSGNPFEFDYALYASRNNIYYQLFTSRGNIEVIKKATDADLSFIRRMHHQCTGILQTYITDTATLGLLEAMLAGDKVHLDNELRQAYADTGIVHILAISGAHITIFFLAFAFLLGWIKHRKYHWIKYIAALPFIWLYVLVAGAPASAVRAATMFSILGIGLSLQKQPNGINQLLATAFILLCIDPMWLYSVGFQLSFVAVLSIFIFYRPVYRLLAPAHRILRSLWGAVAVSIAAEILVAPLIIFYFHLFPAQFIITNILAYLFMGIVLVLGILIVLCSFLPPVAKALAMITIQLSTFFNKLVYSLQHFNFDSFHRLSLSFSELLLVYITVAAIAVYILHKKRPALFTGLSTFMLLLSLLLYDNIKANHQELLIVYNISRGNYIEHIQGRHSTTVYSSEKISDRNKNYILRSAHIGLHINNTTETDMPGHFFNIGDQTACILDESTNGPGTHADYVILNYSPKYSELSLISKNFTPHTLVIGSNITRPKAKRITDSCRVMGISVHYVKEDGAFVLRK